MTTHLAVRRLGVGGEANPVVRGVLRVGGPPALYALKGASVYAAYRVGRDAYETGDPVPDHALAVVGIIGGLAAANNIGVLYRLR